MDTDNVRARLEATFGKALPQALFYNFDIALRFELSLDGDWPTRILQAHRRARTIFDALSTPAHQWVPIFAAYGPSREACAARFSADLLQTYGIPSSRLSHLWSEDDPIDEVDGWPRHFFALSPAPSIDACLLAAVSSDCPTLVMPFAGLPYFVDFESEIIVWTYDDRGVDVVATHPTHLKPLYDRFNDWLLEYDRARMDGAFLDNRR